MPPAMSEYAVIYEFDLTNWAAWVPDLVGCVAVGETRDQVEHAIRLAADEYIKMLRAQGDPIPLPSCTVGTIHVTGA